MKLFDNSYFGKPYKTRGGEKALFQYKDSTLAHLFTESEEIEVFLDDGCVDSRFFEAIIYYLTRCAKIDLLY